MALEPIDWLRRLEEKHNSELGDLKMLNAHYEGTQPLAYLHPDLLAELEGRLQQLVINWPELIVNRLEECMQIRGFRIAGKAKADAGLDEIWQYSNLDELHHQAHIDAFVMRRAYVIVGPADAHGMPPITVESPLEMFAEFDPAIRRERAAYKIWVDQEVEHAALYLPDSTHYFLKHKGEWVSDPDVKPDMHGLGEPPVVALVNRPRTHKPGIGRSELTSVLPLSDAANKMATDMMVSGEFHAMPRRYALGISPDDFVDEQGRRLSVWSKIAGRIWATHKTKQEGAEVGQFPEADLRNFRETIHLLAQLVAGLVGFPQSYFGISTDNPPSADSIRSQESPKVKRAERAAGTLGGPWERAMGLAARRRDNDGPERAEFRRLETLWADPSTPTIAQSTDAAVKKYQAKIVPLRQTREDLGYNEEQINLMEAEDTKQANAEAQRSPVAAIARGLADQRVIDNDGTDSAAA
jgi:hypothetical protein